ncbi:MAG: PDZ domain-containing protein [Myxococcaceae bacterium]
MVGSGRTDARVQLQRAVAVAGSVHDAVTGLPVRGARVLSSKLGMMRLSTPGSETVTDGNGDFVLPALPLPSLVEVRDGLHQSVSADVRTPGQRLDLKMQPGTPPPPRDQFFEYQGIGMLLGVRGQSVSVEEVYEGSPAETAGLHPGDLLVSVDGNPAPPPPQNAVKLIQGPAGTLVTVTVLRGGEQLDFVVRRKQIAL